jgi:hypothetical protein
MGISLRHHVLTLVATFLMLLVGLLVGVGLSSEPGLQDRISELDAKFSLLWRENQTLAEGAERHEDFEQAALPTLVRGRLQGEVIPLLITVRPVDDRQTKDAATQLADALTAAGASVPVRIAWRDDCADRAVAAYGGDPASACEKAAAELARCLARSDEQGLQTLRKRKLIRLQGELPGIRPTAVVILGGAQTEALSASETIDRPLLEALAAAGIRKIVGCEATPPVSYVSTYREFDISTVDNANLARGQVSVVLALAGSPGDYGDGGSGRKFFPELK